MELAISSSVQQVLSDEKISLSEVQEMVSHAAITSLRGFNRRYHHWLFLVRGAELQRMELADKVEEEQAAADCEQCEGAGCHKCEWTGEVTGRQVSPAEIQQVAQAFRARPGNYRLV